MKIQKPTVGPLLGATDSVSARVLLRGKVEGQGGGQPRRAHAVGRIRRAGEEEYSQPLFAKLNPNFDMTAVLVFENLQTQTEYKYQVGWFFSEEDSANLDVNKVLDWEAIEAFGFRTGTSNASAPRRIVVGSCRYLLRLFGGTWFDDRGDKTFGSILKQSTAGERLDSVLMLGDQIYADDILIGADNAVDEYYKRYREAFTTPGLRALMAQIPTYMTLDDHEVEDNWPNSASGRDYMRKFPAAMQAYQVYQLSHSPAFPVVEGRVTGGLDKLFYTFRDGCADFFMCDARTERWVGDGEPRIVSDEQMSALKNWLSDGSGRVKFVGSSVPPFGAKSKDKWEGFVAQRDELLDFIFEKKIPKIVFLSGDVHASFTSELRSPKDPRFQILSVVSSSFFWPWPHPPRGAFQSSGEILSRSENGYFISKASKVHSEDNYTSVKCTPASITVEVFARKGKQLGKVTHAVSE